jgi:hypothetical protein
MSKYLAITVGLISLELAASITGFMNWRKIRHSYWKWFPLYLLLIVLVEITGIYALYGLKESDLNSRIYLYFGIPLQFFFFFWLIAQYLKPYRESKWPLFGAAIYLLSWMADIGYFSGKAFWFSSFSYTAGNLVLLVLILLFFNRFIKIEVILRYQSSIMFWVCVGLLVFYLGTFPFFAFRKVLQQDFKTIFSYYWYIFMALDYLMYIFFILAFKWGKPN